MSVKASKSQLKMVCGFLFFCTLDTNGLSYASSKIAAYNSEKPGPLLGSLVEAAPLFEHVGHHERQVVPLLKDEEQLPLGGVGMDGPAGGVKL